MLTVAVLMLLFAIVPGLPFAPFTVGGLALGGMALWLYSQEKTKKPDPKDPEPEITPVNKSLGDLLDLDDVHVEFSPDLVNMVLDPGTGLDAKIENMRRHVASHFGVILPEIRLTDEPSLHVGTYVVRIQGVEQARAVLRLDHIMALDPEGHADLPAGETVNEPVYGAPARWIPEGAEDAAALSGVTLVYPAEVLATHLLEVIKRNLGRLLTMKSMRALLDEMVNLSDPNRAEANRKLLDEMIPDRVPTDVLHAVLRLLLTEQVSVRNMPLILEAIAEAKQHHPTTEAICEHVRQRLGFQLVSELQRDDGSLPLIQLAPEWEDTFATYQIEGDRGRPDIALPPELFNSLTQAAAEEVSRVGDQGFFPAIVTSAPRRRFLRTVLTAKSIMNPVMSFEEIGVDARPALVGVIPA